jgi:hypothetical protein
MTDAESFDTSFVAMSFFLGKRTELVAGLLQPSEAAQRAAERLSATAQVDRARHLAALLKPIVQALATRSIP